MSGAIHITGLAELRNQLAAFSDRRFAAAMATALTRTAVALRDELRREVLPQVFDRPTPYTLNSLFVQPATAERLQARVWFKDDSATTKAGTPATKYLMPHAVGGPRRAKRLEVALAAAGALPAGWLVVPGPGATLDNYGNVSRGQIVQVLSQLRIQLVAGSNRNMSFDARKAINAQRRAGGRFFVVREGERGGLRAGIYQREFIGRNITPVFLFVRAANYRQSLPFQAESADRVSKRLPQEIERAVREHLQRMNLKGAR